ncbi:Poly-beta-1,6-N-acetyl-D-glucosamine synthase [Hartmannibacter diazotrophicus]|uniref:Poly-beta-1,6-N-acetyl-D-glucosamine synthase n=1 Tax=Hartmannibacter diazotrophicus TaxID=1482074 RepID=A0A2C9D2V0_9HYPH|nr:glycosyltransferase family 2 protein [Hartmannibacter diazotrophicus]SON54111.1 Poly-beta-1,6-N-acetyl-D-glucosamine synthase [Hartmannibacter diazotrophicus]
MWKPKDEEPGGVSPVRPEAESTSIPPLAAIGLAGEAGDLLAVAADHLGRPPAELVLRLGILSPDDLQQRLASLWDLPSLSGATVDLLDRLAPRWEGELALALLGDAAFRRQRGLVIALNAPLHDLDRRLPQLLAARRLGLTVYLGPMTGRHRFVIWDLGDFRLDMVVKAASGQDGLAVLARQRGPGPAEFYRLLANRYGLDFASPGDLRSCRLEGGPISPEVARRAPVAFARLADDRPVILCAPRIGRIEADLHRVLTEHRLHRPVVLCPPRDLHRLVREAAAPEVLRRDLTRLDRERPALSARRTPSPSLRFSLALWLLALAVLAAAAPLVFIHLGLALTMVGFLSVGLVRFFAARAMGLQPPRAFRPPRDPPVCSVLVALYDEADMVPGLVGALERLRYPRDRLELRIVCEADDRATIAAAEAALAGLPHGEVIVVPDGRPRTKPRALAYGLAFCEGAMVTVFDAEDRPHPDQLLRAAQAFAEGPSDLGCVQARLVIDRIGNTLQKQFAIEYAALFDGLLPFFARYRLPVPLAGTSNHFKRQALDEVLGWDPWNVTEDADLSIRLVRAGWQIDLIDAVTLEEAPRRFTPWRRQRSRWIKGWMVTWLVHMRQPWRLWREVGPLGFAVIQLYFGGVVLSALAHPAGVMLILFNLLGIWPVLIGGDPLSDTLMACAVLNILFGYGASMWLAARSLAVRRRFALSGAILWMPVYWLLVSVAAWGALFQLIARPHHWAKTPHEPHDRPDGEPLGSIIPKGWIGWLKRRFGGRRWSG